MATRIGAVLAITLLGSGTVGAQPPPGPIPSVLGVVDKYNVEKNYIFIRTDRDSVLPPLVIGRDVQFILDGKVVANLRDLRPDDLRKLANRRVEVTFRDEGKRHVADMVKSVPR